jgi:hypothetical protein
MRFRTAPFALTASVTVAVTVAIMLARSPDASAFDWEPQVAPAPATTEDAPQPAAPASAESATPAPPLPHVDFELGGRAGYLSSPIRGATNPFGAGVGGRFGLVWSGVYVGVSAMDYLGGSDVDVSYRALTYGLEVGYGFRVLEGGAARPQLVLRPLLGVGVAEIDYTDPTLAQQVDVVTSASTGRTTATRSTTSDTVTVDNVYLQPGLTAVVAYRSLFAGACASMFLLPGISYGGADPTTWISYGVDLQAGLRF